MKHLCNILILCCFTACCTQQGYTEQKTVYVETIHKDTVVSFAPDTASIVARLQCDSIGNVLLQQIDFLQGENLTLSAQLQNKHESRFPVATLKVDCKQDSLQKEIDLLTKTIRENSATVQTVEVHKLNAWQAFIQVTGYLTWLCLIFHLILRAILKSKNMS